MNIFIDTIRAVAYAIIQPPYVFFIMAAAFVFYKNNIKIVAMQKMIMGTAHESTFLLTIPQIILGIVGGVLASVILSSLGIIFRMNSYIELIFLISIALMFLKPRFICFSYSGAVLGVTAIVIDILNSLHIDYLTFPKLEVDLYSIVVVVAVLHIVEGLLILFDGGRGAIPVFSSRNNKIIGGFALKRTWIIPIALLFLNNRDMSYSLLPITSIPNLWGFISTLRDFALVAAAIGFDIFYAATGYSSITFTKDKNQKVLSSSIFVLSYGSILLFFSLIFRNYYYGNVMLIILMPILHEAMIKYQNHLEDIGEPKFVTEDGVVILDVAENSPAKEMGIVSGDVLIELNSKKINNEQELKEGFSEVTSFICLKIRNSNGEFKEFTYNRINKSKGLGVVIVPRDINYESTVVRFDQDKFKEVLDKIKKKK